MSTAAQKTCTKCDTLKNLGEFPRDKKNKDGYSNQCKACRRAYKKKNAESIAETRKKYKDTPTARFAAYKYSAKYRGYLWKLTFKQFMKFWKLSCVWCGDSIETIGLDRIDPEKPYELHNVEPCCKHCNRMKSDLSSIEFLKHVKKIYKFSKENP